MRIAIPAVLPSILAVLAVTAAAPAQTDDPSSIEPLPTIDELPPLEFESGSSPRGFKYAWNIGAAYQTGGADFNVFRLRTGLSASTRINSDVDLQLSFSYEFDNYDFDEINFFGGDVWDEVNTFGVRASFNFKVDSDWTLFVGPVFQVSQESGADLDESWVGGGFAGLTYQLEPGVLIGGGLAITDQLQDTARFQPIIILDWEVSSDLKLTSQTAVGLTGVNAVFSLYESLDLALGVAYIYKRFRMDESGIFPGGVGQETGVPVYVSATYKLSPSSTITAYAGVVFGGEIELETREGGVSKYDYDRMGLFGFSLAFRF